MTMRWSPYEPSYGARPVKRLMQRELVNLLAKAILDGSVHRDSTITVDSAGGQILLRNEKKTVSLQDDN